MEDAFESGELDRLIATCIETGLMGWQLKKRPESPEAEAAKKILALEKPGQVAALRRLARIIAVTYNNYNTKSEGVSLLSQSRSAQDLFSSIARRRPPCTQQDLIHILENILQMGSVNLNCAPVKSIVGLCERGLEDETPDDVLAHLLGRLSKKFANRDFAEDRAVAARIDQLLEKEVVTQIDGNDVWARAALDRLEEMPAQERQRWEALLSHAVSAPAAKPPKKWLKKAREMVEAIGPETFAAEVAPWFRLVGLKGTGPKGRFSYDARDLLQGHNGEILRGLACCCTGLRGESLAPALGHMGAAGYKAVRGHGRCHVGIGNACVIALASMSGVEPIAQLSRLRRTAKMPKTEAFIDKELTRLADDAGLTTDEIEDMALPTFGMESVGELRLEMGAHTAVLRVSGTRTTELRWVGKDGSEQKSIPAAVKKHFPDELKALKLTIKDISALLVNQRERLQQCYLENPREWPFATWRERILDQPLMGTLARRLIWDFEGPGERQAAGAWQDGALVDAQSRSIDWLEDSTAVRLWHPLGSEEDEVRSWRDWVEGHGVQQPFKQAHREVYTPAAEAGSNAHQSRQFADHILRQHQMVRLAKSRGWIATPHGVGDVNTAPELRLPRRGLRVELAIEGVYRDHDDVTSSKHFLATTTGAVCFFDHEGEAVPLAALPPMVFSEVMRHVDLFVSVASIANEPEESDEEFQAYLRSFPQSELRASGEVRKEILEGLVSRATIADRCSFTDRFLKVRGAIASYRIHIGSGTVLLETEDRFLRFESDKAANAAATRFFKSAPPPFEGDDLVALIIGRALVLAKDKNITDEALLRQIRGVLG